MSKTQMTETISSLHPGRGNPYLLSLGGMVVLPGQMVLNFEFWSFEFVSNFGFRISKLAYPPNTA
jgi:hypothetical protein